MRSSSTTSRVLDRRHETRTAASDRRTFARVGTDLYVNRFLNGHPYMCRMTDISRTGARLVPLLEPDTSRSPRFMGLQFQLPGQDEILTASGEMISLKSGTTDGKSVGIRFTNLPPQAAWAIEAFLKAA
ncbi:MAG TPA: PilZ domain-containing protein [Polyangia bacterium]|nr:PilZ domain-containing protein [Polyangia bacterium]